MSSPTPRAVLASLRAHPQSQALCTRVAQVVLAAAVARRPEVLSGSQVIELPASEFEQLPRSDASTEFGNLLEILDAGARTAVEWLLLSVSVALDVGRRGAQARDAIPQLIWLAEATPCNPWIALDDCLDEVHAPDFWQQASPALAQASATAQLAIAAALGSASSAAARGARDALGAATSAPTVLQLLEIAHIDGPLRGEVGSKRSGAWGTVFAAATGWLLLRGVWRITTRHLLGARSLGELQIERQCLTLVQRRRLLGREFAERRTTLPLAGLTQLTRETRFAGMGVYLGLLSLCVGTLIGTGLVVDSVRVAGGSPSLLVSGVLVILAGVVLDLLLSSLGRYRSGKTSVVIVPLRGRPLVLERVAIPDADAWLRKLSTLAALSR